MKTSSTVLTSTAGAIVLGLVVLLSACSKTHDASATTASNNPANPPMAGANAQGVPALWDTLKNASFDERADVVAKVNQYAEKLDTDAKTAKGAAANRLAQARDDLRTAATEANNATATTWQATKDKIGDAWQKAESAYQNAAE